MFAVLSDPFTYGDWVVGSDAVREADPEWPAPGARLHHRVGLGPLSVDDHTEVLECDAPWRLALRAQARPLGSARVELILTPRQQATLVTMLETADGTLSRLTQNALTDWAIDLRNRESLRRLARLAEARESHLSGA